MDDNLGGDRLTLLEIDSALKDWFLGTWNWVMICFTILCYPSTLSIFCLLVAMILSLARNKFLIALSVLLIVGSAVGNCFYSYNTFFINTFRVYPPVQYASWQWIAGSVIAHVAMLAVTILRMVLRSSVGTTKVLNTISTLSSR